MRRPKAASKAVVGKRPQDTGVGPRVRLLLQVKRLKGGLLRRVGYLADLPDLSRVVAFTARQRVAHRAQVVTQLSQDALHSTPAPPTRFPHLTSHTSPLPRLRVLSLIATTDLLIRDDSATFFKVVENGLARITAIV